MQLRQENSQQQKQSQKIGPQLIHANTLLQCSSTELLQIIEREQLENPALDNEGLETDQKTLCSNCPTGGIVPCSFCPYNRAGHPLSNDAPADQAHQKSSDEHTLPMDHDDGNDDAHLMRHEKMDLLQSGEDNRWTQAGNGDSDFDPLTLISTESTLGEQLLVNLRAMATDSDDMRIAEYLVDSLDERGYLTADPEEAGHYLNVPCSQVQLGIERLQSCDPPGIGARNLQECLLLQLREYEEDPALCVLVEKMIREHWTSLIQRRNDQLPRRLRTSPEKIEEAVNFIQKKLTPNPAARFRQPWVHRPDSHSMMIRPDVIVTRAAMGFQVEVQGYEHVALHINPYYQNLYDTIMNAQNGGSTQSGLTRDHEQHIVSYVERANLFLKNIQRRKRTIQKIATVLLQLQQGFVETGQRSFLRPLTRTQLAEKIGMHESTISRALLHKFIRLPSQDVVPFQIFFEQSANLKDMVAAIIAEENPAAPLSDQAIMEMLETRGHTIARRTVVKYREELRIPASYMRRKR